VSVTTRSQTGAGFGANADVTNNNVVDNNNDDVLDVDDVTPVSRDCINANSTAFALEQHNDVTLNNAFDLARLHKGGYSIVNDLLYRKEHQCGQELLNLVVPTPRRTTVLQLAHNSCHFAGKRTYERIILSGLTWGPSDVSKSVRADAIAYAATCKMCQLHARATCFDHVPIRVIPRDGAVFRHFQVDVMGPIVPSEKLKYNYAVLIIDSATRYPYAYPLRAANTKNICDALMKMFELTGIASEMVLTSDNASYNKSAFMREFLKRLGITPRFSTSYHPEGHALVEQGIQSLQNLIVKLAGTHRNGWTAYLGAALWGLRETKNQTTGLPPHLMVFGYLPRGPLSILTESWTGGRDTPIDINVNADKYLSDLRDRLQVASDYADENAEREHVTYGLIIGMHVTNILLLASSV